MIETDTVSREVQNTTQVDPYTEENTMSCKKPNQAENRTFAQVMLDEMEGAIPLRSQSTPKLIGGNEDEYEKTINEDEYEKGLRDFIISLIGRLVLAKGDKTITTLELKTKLSSI